MTRKESAERRERIVEWFKRGLQVHRIAIREHVSIRIVYYALDKAGLTVSLQRCARDGKRGQWPLLEVDGVAYLLCSPCRKTLLPLTGVREPVKQAVA